MDDITTRQADTERRMESLIRTGTIASVDLASARATVTSGGLTTTGLPWLEVRAGTTTVWNPPTVGEQVVLLCPSGDPSTGILLRGLHSDGIAPPDSSADTHVTKYPDGAVVSYNHASSHLEVSGIKTATIVASELITLDVPETVITGNVTIKGHLLVKLWATVEGLLTYLAGLTGYGTGTGAGTVIRGPITQTEGGYTTDHDVVASGISLTGHTHQENGEGGGTTSAPNGGSE